MGDHGKSHSQYGLVAKKVLFPAESQFFDKITHTYSPCIVRRQIVMLGSQAEAKFQACSHCLSNIVFKKSFLELLKMQYNSKN